MVFIARDTSLSACFQPADRYLNLLSYWKQNECLNIRFANVWLQIKQMYVWAISTHLTLWVAVARHNFKWVNTYFFQCSALTLEPPNFLRLNFHPPEVVSCWRDPQLQVVENYTNLTKWRWMILKYCRLIYLQHVEKLVFNVLTKNKNKQIYSRPAIKGLICVCKVGNHPLNWYIPLWMVRTQYFLFYWRSCKK